MSKEKIFSYTASVVTLAIFGVAATFVVNFEVSIPKSAMKPQKLTSSHHQVQYSQRKFPLAQRAYATTKPKHYEPEIILS